MLRRCWQHPRRFGEMIFFVFLVSLINAVVGYGIDKQSGAAVDSQETGGRPAIIVHTSFGDSAPASFALESPSPSDTPERSPTPEETPTPTPEDTPTPMPSPSSQPGNRRLTVFMVFIDNTAFLCHIPNGVRHRRVTAD
jgi:hypothetical protein